MLDGLVSKMLDAILPIIGISSDVFEGVRSNVQRVLASRNVSLSTVKSLADISGVVESITNLSVDEITSELHLNESLHLDSSLADEGEEDI